MFADMIEAVVGDGLLAMEKFHVRVTDEIRVIYDFMGHPTWHCKVALIGESN